MIISLFPWLYHFSHDYITFSMIISLFSWLYHFFHDYTFSPWSYLYSLNKVHYLVHQQIWQIWYGGGVKGSQLLCQRGFPIQWVNHVMYIVQQQCFLHMHTYARIKFTSKHALFMCYLLSLHFFFLMCVCVCVGGWVGGWVCMGVCVCVCGYLKTLSSNLKRTILSICEV